MKHIGGLPNFETQKPGPRWVKRLKRLKEVTHLTSLGLEGGDCDMVKLYKVVDLYSHVVHHLSF